MAQEDNLLHMGLACRDEGCASEHGKAQVFWLENREASRKKVANTAKSICPSCTIRRY